jgi:threonylcarbamoyladenosine tRNA methylthiotransferase MtaB
MDGVSMVVPNNEKEHIANRLCNFTSCKDLKISQNSRSRAFVKVQDGCNNGCSYCVIPRARGVSRSREINEVIEDINFLESSHNEIVITGIHLGTYGYDLIPKASLSVLLSHILQKTKIKRVRLSSLEINEIDAELIELIQEDRVCKHLHIPLQSGDDRILCLMERNYNISQFKDIYSLVCRKLPGISIGTDIIVGFPGEGAIEFENTKGFIEDSYISYMHVFPFSPRKGTKAFEMKPRVNDLTIKKRCEVLRSLGKKKKSDYMHKQIGKVLDLLVEEIDEYGFCTGTTANYLRVRACLESPRLKDVAYVRIAGVKDDTLIGYLIEPS